MNATCISTVDDEKVLPAQYIQFEDQIGKAYLKYRPKPYAGKMTLFRATNRPLGIVPDPTLGWEGIPAELEIHDVPGRHRSLVAEPYVGVLAAMLSYCLLTALPDDIQFWFHRRAGKGLTNG